jgi:hypothetical protein
MWTGVLHLPSITPLIQGEKASSWQGLRSFVVEVGRSLRVCDHDKYVQSQSDDELWKRVLRRLGHDDPCEGFPSYEERKLTAEDVLLG